jgi:hypothetical protein
MLPSPFQMTSADSSAAAALSDALDADDDWVSPLVEVLALHAASDSASRAAAEMANGFLMTMVTFILVKADRFSPF